MPLINNSASPTHAVVLKINTQTPTGRSVTFDIMPSETTPTLKKVIAACNPTETGDIAFQLGK